MSVVTQTRLPRFSEPISAWNLSGLHALRRDVQRGGEASQQSLQVVARQFEALLIQSLLRQARQSTQGLSQWLDTSATRTAQSLADEQLAITLADPGLGLAEALLAQMNLGRGLPKTPLPVQDLSAHEGSKPAGRAVIADSISELLDKLSGSPAVDHVAAPLGNDATPPHVGDFLSRMGPAAHRVARESGLPAELILGQAALESGWGQREILYPDGRTSHNVFGIKAGSGWHGAVVEVLTTEYIDGHPRKMKQDFRAYASYEEAFADYARLISRSPRYQSVLEARDAVDAAYRIQAAGYATDPRYADKLVAIMAHF